MTVENLGGRVHSIESLRLTEAWHRQVKALFGPDPDYTHLCLFLLNRVADMQVRLDAIQHTETKEPEAPQWVVNIPSEMEMKA